MRILYVLTGPPGCGKTTAILKIKNILESSNVKVDGMYTEEIRVSGRRVGFKVTRIATGESEVMAHVDFTTSYRVGKYFVDLEILENVGVAGILNGLNFAEVVIVDEVGPMELYSSKFINAVKKILSHSIPAILTVHYRASHPIVNEVKKTVGSNLITLNEANRDRIPNDISRKVLETLRKPAS
ncbi:MAG: NTPase [Nitrososphaerota archaeon]